jgi:hypothetical protein
MTILTYGQPKSASTFVTHIVKRCCEIKHGSQDDLRARLSNEFSHENFSFWGGDLSPIKKFLDGIGPDEALVIKTHSPVAPEILDEINRGLIVPIITYRNVGDAALSAFDAGVKARKTGNMVQIETKGSTVDTVTLVKP